MVLAACGQVLLLSIMRCRQGETLPPSITVPHSLTDSFADLSGLGGAEGYTPPGPALEEEEELSSSGEPDTAELRRRRLQKLESPPAPSH